MKPGEAEHFLIGVYSPISARSGFTVALKTSSRMVVESNPVDLNVFTPNRDANYDEVPLPLNPEKIPIPAVSYKQ